jgi:hypothetical protein
MKKFYIYIEIIKSFLILFVDIFRLIIFFLPKKRSQIFLQLEGGFGHTISEPHFLKITQKKKWFIVVAFDKNFHNKCIDKVFYPNLIWIKKTRIYWRFSYQIEKIITFLFKFILLTNVQSTYDYIMKLECKVKKNNYHKMLESRTFKKFFINRKHNYYDNYLKSLNFDEILNQFKNYKGLINFQIRSKGKLTLTYDEKSQLRDFDKIESYKLAIEYIIRDGWIVVFGGDKFKIPDWLSRYEDRIIFKEKFRINNDMYNIFAGLKTDIYIGPTSGATMFSLINPKKKQLILNCLPFGYGYANSVVAYPLINFLDKKDFKEILTFNIYNKNSDFEILKKRSFRMLNEIEIKNIISDYLNNFDNDYGLTFKDLNICNGIMNDSNFKISEKWIELVNFRNLK